MLIQKVCDMNSFLPWILMIKESFSLVRQPCIWHLSLETESSQIWGLQRKTKNCNVFSFRLPPEKGNDKVFQRLYKKTCFLNSLGLRSKCFSRKSTSTTYFLTRFLLLYKISEKSLMNGFPENWFQKDGWRDG